MQATHRIQISGGKRRPSNALRRTLFVLIVLLGVALWVPTAMAQAAPAPAAPPSETELKARAYDAQQAQAKAEKARADTAKAAQEADAAAAAAAQQAEQAQRALESAGATPTPVMVQPGPPPTPAPVVVPAPVPTPTPVAAPPAPVPTAAGPDPQLAAAQAELEKAKEEAENAAAAARAANRALEEHLKEREDRYARKGFFIAGGAFWAPSLFDTSLTIDPSLGAWGAMGYRFTRRFEVDVRFDWLDGFDVSGLGTAGRVSGWSATANAKLFLLTKSFQPYLGVGLGAMQAKTELFEIGGPGYINRTETVATFRTFGGFDYYISETFALTADAAVNLPGGDLSSLTYATISAGVKLRF